MTTVQTMLRALSPRYSALSAAAFALTLAAGCESGRDRAVLVPPEVLVAPYDTTGGDALWAVVPLGNQSGVSSADTNAIADALVAKIDEARGVACLPLNRTIAAMRARNLGAIRSPADARALASALGVDAVVVGNLTAFDPYDPPKLGLAIALYSRDRKPAEPLDPMRLRSSYSDRDYTISTSRFDERPVAVVSEHLDGANHEVQMDLQRYASGRHDADTALGWRTWLASMDLYTEFAAHTAVSRLLDQERLRVGQPGVTPPAEAQGSANAAP